MIVQGAGRSQKASSACRCIKQGIKYSKDMYLGHTQIEAFYSDNA